MLIKKDPDFIKSYFEDSSNIKGGYADAVMIPRNTGEIVKVLTEADREKTPVTVSGGGTGTTGSRVPFGGLVLSLEKFNHIIKLDEVKMSAVVEPGVLVEDLKDACESKGLFYTSHLCNFSQQWTQ